MKVYHVETQQNYDALMVELEAEGYKWLSGYKLTSKNYWKLYKENTCIVILAKYIIFMDIKQSKKKYPNIPIIGYKAKGEKMTQQEEMKRNILDLAKDVSVAVVSFSRDMSESESDLQEAKSSAKKLIEKIDEYLESQKPKFKKGDIIASQVFGNGGFVLVRLDENLSR